MTILFDFKIHVLESGVLITYNSEMTILKHVLCTHRKDLSDLYLFDSKIPVTEMGVLTTHNSRMTILEQVFHTLREGLP